MWLDFALIFGGLIICSLIGHWTVRPAHETDSFWT